MIKRIPSPDTDMMIIRFFEIFQLRYNMVYMSKIYPIPIPKFRGKQNKIINNIFLAHSV